MHSANGRSPLLLVEPTRVASFNIRARTIHSSLRIPIKECKPLHGQALFVFEEEMWYVKCIFIYEMSFIGPMLFVQIDSRLREAFIEKKWVPFGKRSIIFVTNLGQLPHVRDKMVYVGNIALKILWKDFKKVVTLDDVFVHKGQDPKQSIFQRILTNIKNAVALTCFDVTNRCIYGLCWK